MAEFIRIEHLNKSYHDRPVLQDLSLSIPIGQITAVMAPSGVGKTTLLRILMGLETADSGKIEGLDGLRLSAVFQEDRLCANLSPVSNIRLVTGSSLSRQEILSALEQTGLSDCAGQPARELSGGQRRGQSGSLRALLGSPGTFSFWMSLSRVWIRKPGADHGLCPSAFSEARPNRASGHP